MEIDYPCRCTECGKEQAFMLDTDAIARWHKGELIQNVFPQLSDDERELLISGTCGECFDKLFAESEGA